MLNFFRKKRIPVLCYHSMNADTEHYYGNDHIALTEDLSLLKQYGYRLISGMDIIDFITGEKHYSVADKVVCISIDDAPVLDYFDYQSPKIGRVRSFRSIFLASTIFQESEASILNFAIVDEATREELDQACMQGNGDWHSDWWQSAIAEGLYDMANHSFDHMHGALKQTRHSRGEKGNFFAVDNYLDADQQIRQGYNALQNYTNGSATPLFAYPYGHCSNYLRDEYFPEYSDEHHQKGAFTTAGEYVTRQTNRWSIPRFVCGEHWKSPADFRQLLTAC